MTGRVVLSLALLSLAVGGSLVGTLANAQLLLRGLMSPDQVGGAVFPPLAAVPFAVVGAVVSLRRPRSVIGRLMLGIGALMGAAYAADAYADWDLATSGSLPGADVAAWLAGTLWIVIVTIVIPRLLVLFPDGHIPAPRWRLLAVLQGVLAIGIALVALTPGQLPDYPYENPFGIAMLSEVGALLIAGQSLLFLLMFVVLVAACLSMLDRFRRSSRLQREQLKWIAWVVLVVAATETIAIVTSPIWPELGNIVSAITVLAIVLLPVAIGIAVLRYRLYEIDRIISRTIGWALVTGILVAVFAAGVLGLQAALADVTQGGTLAVAASTLLAFALFQPLRRQIQRAVDRRFDRARYDGERVVAAFGERLRADVDLVGVEADVAATVRGALRPGSVAVWVRGEGE